MAEHLERYDEPGKPAVGIAGANTGVWARWINVALGLWLILAALLWAPGPGPRTNTGLVGLVIAAVAVWAMWNAGMRYLNTALALWLAISTLGSVQLKGGTLFWNNLLVAAAVFVVSLIPSRSRVGGGGRRRYAAP